MEKIKVRTKIYSTKQLLEQGYPHEKLVARIVEINQRVWPEPFPQKHVWTPSSVTSQIQACPELQLCAINDDNVIMGTLTLMLTNYSEAENCVNWEDMTSNGFLENHLPDGDVVFGVDLSVDPDFAGKNVSTKLEEQGIFRSIIEANTRGAFFGSRIPRFYKQPKNMPVEQYVGTDAVSTKDPEVRMYLNNGFQIIRIIPDYIEDPESRNYGVLMYFANPTL